MKKYTFYTKNITVGGYVDNNLANSISFVNIGTATATVQGFPILQNQTLSIPGNADEVCVTKFKVEFDGVGTQNLYILFKEYINH